MIRSGSAGSSESGGGVTSHNPAVKKRVFSSAQVESVHQETLKDLNGFILGSVKKLVSFLQQRSSAPAGLWSQLGGTRSDSPSCWIDCGSEPLCRTCSWLKESFRSGTAEVLDPQPELRAVKHIKTVLIQTHPTLSPRTLLQQPDLQTERWELKLRLLSTC